MMFGWLLACAGEPEPAVPMSRTVETGLSETGTVVMPVCPDFGAAEAVGRVSDARIVEASGLAFAADRFWTHNDSGAALLFGMTDQGGVDRVVEVEDVAVGDWEDLAAVGDSLWIADVGDNLAVRPKVALFEVVLPDTGDSTPGRTVRLTWPEGPVDCETLLADPISGDLLLVSKDFSGESLIVRVVEPQAEESETEEVARVQFGAGGIGSTTLVTGGDISPDGTMVVLRTYLSAWGFPRIPGEPWGDTFAREPCEVPVVGESQGEAIAWAQGAVWTVSEGESPALNRTTVVQ